MIPIGDDIPLNRVPFVTYALIIANIFVFLYELSLGSGLPVFFQAHGLIPHGVTGAALAADPQAVFGRFFSSMFIHGSPLHLAGNMIYLWIFGDNVEDRLGHFRYLGFYFVAGFLAMGAHVLSAPGSVAPALGASGAIAGILGAYLVMFPRAKVLLLLPLLIIWPVISIPAIFALGFWFAEQVISGTGALGGSASTNIAFWAHIGGFMAGMLLVGFFRKRHPNFRDFHF